MESDSEVEQKRLDSEVKFYFCFYLGNVTLNKLLSLKFYFLIYKLEIIIHRVLGLNKIIHVKHLQKP